MLKRIMLYLLSLGGMGFVLTKILGLETCKEENEWDIDKSYSSNGKKSSKIDAIQMKENFKNSLADCLRKNNLGSGVTKTGIYAFKEKGFRDFLNKMLGGLSSDIDITEKKRRLISFYESPDSKGIVECNFKEDFSALLDNGLIPADILQFIRKYNMEDDFKRDFKVAFNKLINSIYKSGIELAKNEIDMEMHSLKLAESEMEISNCLRKLKDKVEYLLNDVY